MKVWIENWEWQCCGEPFAVGSFVRWGLVPSTEESRTFLAGPLGEELSAAITHYETHHEQADDPLQPLPTRGRVESIQAVYWMRAPRSGENPRALWPVEGTAELRSRDQADGWEPESEDGPSFEGYIVELAAME
jgi:hypothetical protein